MLNLAPYPKFRAFDSAGAPLAGGKLYTYTAGTSTPKAAYLDNDLTSQHTNPIILDARGEADVFLNGTYKFILRDADDVLITTQDDMQPSWYGVAMFTVATISALRSITTVSGQIIYVKAHSTAGDNGGGFFRGVTGAPAGTYTDDDGLTTVLPTGGDGSTAHLRLNIGAVYPEFAGGDTAAINAAFAEQSVKLDNKEYVVDAELVASENLHKLVGEGWHRDAAGTWHGSKITAASSAVTNLLKISGGTDGRGLKLSDFAMFPKGSGAALHIENLIYADISHMRILGDNVAGSTGVHLDTAYFGTLNKLVVTGFPGRALLIDGLGTQNIVKDCVLSSSVTTDAEAAAETRRPGTIFQGGQINAARATGDGIGILFNNIDSSAMEGGFVSGVLSEADIAVKITGVTHPFANIIVDKMRAPLGSGQTACFFHYASNCKLLNPQIGSPTGGTSVNFGEFSVSNELIGNYDACRAGIVVHASALRSKATCTERITLTQRGDLSVQSNLLFIAEHVEDLGKCTHNGTAWDKDRASIADDTAESFLVPSIRGIVSVGATSNLGDYVRCMYDSSLGTLEAYDTGSRFEINATDGTLTGTTGTDGKLTIRCSSATAEIYVENRRGATRNVTIKFEPFN